MRSDLRRERGTCGGVAPLLAGVVDGSATLDAAERRHVDQCLRCQAELAQHRKLRRAMAALRAGTATPPAGLAGDVVVHLSEAGTRRATRAALSGRRVAYLGGIAAAATAAGAGAAIVLVKGRRGRLPIAG